MNSLTNVPFPKVEIAAPTVIDVISSNGGITTIDIIKTDQINDSVTKETIKEEGNCLINKQYITNTPFVIQTPKTIPKLNIPPLEVQEEQNQVSISNTTFKPVSSTKETKIECSLNNSQESRFEFNQNSSNKPFVVNAFPQQPISDKKEVRMQCCQAPLNHLIALKTKEKKKPDWERLKQVSKTNEACQQAVFIGLLNLFGYEIGIERVYKISKKTFPLLTLSFVHKLTSEGKVDMDIMAYAKKMSDDMLKTSSVEDKKKRRQHKRNMDATICNSLMGYLEKEGVKFEIKGTRSAQYTMIMKKVKDIDLVLFNKHRKISQKEIVNIGKYINNHLVKMMGGLKRRAVSSEQFIKIEPYETTITGIFLNHFNGLLKEFDDSTKCIDIDCDNHQEFSDPSMSYHSIPALQPHLNLNKMKYPNEYYSFVKQDIIDFMYQSFF